MTTDLYQLARPFPDSMIEKKPGAKFQAAYVSHGAITSRMLEVLGPFDWCISRIITDADDVAVGCLGRLELRRWQETVEAMRRMADQEGDA